MSLVAQWYSEREGPAGKVADQPQHEVTGLQRHKQSKSAAAVAATEYVTEDLRDDDKR